ncbi:hypothetical protein LDZ44_04540 [Bacteroides xylanisolvens]|uniref:Uncharacterized protein n=1 Tax=Bacteroides xylanisolvens TaxID=371601 RepID=A0AAW4SLI2_9BACE|nr:hypothetical protein [Bacteroides xylanisolvens]MCA4465853.1 hypothetical protein [Bacteroides xylanisolvens]MCA4470300.1 hypothetical protein [Bacteroides xylanisolvens]MCA4478214.1 hypothetical protein [Bacteroides xylanisolvens]MCA4487455.1 hypothetical protein [Bacteroides xylanisolvens]MCA4493111.1 hypothetical protein [Bacteroides xylanisolvens]
MKNQELYIIIKKIISISKYWNKRIPMGVGTRKCDKCGCLYDYYATPMLVDSVYEKYVFPLTSGSMLCKNCMESSKGSVLNLLELSVCPLSVGYLVSNNIDIGDTVEEAEKLKNFYDLIVTKYNRYG